MKAFLRANQVRTYIKPLVFAAALTPFVLIALRAFDLWGPSLGANPVEYLQDYIGIWGLRLMLITLAITPLQQLTGQNWLLMLRRMLGLYALFYCAMHFLCWLILDQGLLMSAIIEDIVERPFITIGTASLLILIPLGITSLSVLRRKMGPRRWKRLHQLSYIAAILMVWHYYWQVKLDTVDALIYAIILTALLGWRLWQKHISRKQTYPA